MDISKLKVLILDGEGDLPLFVARCLGQIPGWKMHTLSNIPWAPLRFSRYQSSYYHIQPHSAQERIDQIDQAIKRTQADILLPVSEAIRFVSAHYDTLTALKPITPTSELALFEKVVDKWSLAEFLLEHQIPCPPTVLCPAGEELEQRLEGMPFPMLLKPAQGSDGRGIHYFADLAGLLDFLKKSEEVREQYIIQSFIQGYDISCGVLCENGQILAHTIQAGVVLRARQFASPAVIKFIESAQTYEVVHKLVAALNWNGVANIDLRYDEQDKQVKVLEVNPRYWGSLLGSLSAGINFPYLACLAGLGISFPRPAYDLKHYAAGKVAIQQNLQRYFGKSKVDFSFDETSWKYAVADPIAELAKMSRVVFAGLGGFFN